VTQGKYKEMMIEVKKNKGMGVDLSQEVEKPAQDLAMTKEQTVEPVLKKEKEKVEELAPKALELSADAIDLPKQDPVPLKIPPFVGLLTGDEKTAHIDKALKGASEETIIATLKDQVAKGGTEVVGLIVDATKPGAKHENVKTLSAAQFKEVYDEGMKGAKAKVDTPAPLSAKPFVAQRRELENVQSSCSKMTKAAGVDDTLHTTTARTNTINLSDKLQQRGR